MVMVKTFVAILFVFLSRAVGENVVTIYQESFETPSSDHPELPAGWQLFPASLPVRGGPVKLDTGMVHAGKRCLVLTAAGSRFELTTKALALLKSGRNLTIRIWSRSELKNGQATLVVYWFDQYLRPLGSQPLELPEEANLWIESTFLVNMPVKAARFGFHLGVNGTGKVRIDDLTVTQAVQPQVSSNRRIATAGKLQHATTRPATTQPTSRRAPTLQIRLRPEKLRIKSGQSLNIQASVTHTRSEPARIHLNIALFRGSRNRDPIGTKVYLVTVRPKQTIELHYTLDSADLPAGSYRLVCHAEAPDETLDTVAPVEVLMAPKTAP